MNGATASTGAPVTEPPALPPYSPRLHRYFARFLTRYFRRHFDAVRIAADGLPDLPDSGPVVVCTNHPSWWDPITLLLVAHRCFPERRCYGPIDAAALTRYPILGRLGLFGVERDSRASLRGFLAATDAILAQDDAALGLTAEGGFADARRRPVELEAGIAHLLRRHPRAAFTTIAIEYPFWNERAPEVLIRFSATEPGDAARGERDVDDLRAAAADTLGANMDRLAELAQTRDPSQFHTLVDGRKGVGGFYDLGRRLRSWARGERFDASHAAARRKRTP